MDKGEVMIAQQYNQQGCILHAAKKYEEAIDLFKKAELEDPSFIEAYVNEGSAYAMLEDYHRARETYKKVLNLDKENALAYFYLGNIEFLTNNISLGKEYYAKAQNRGYEDTSLYMNLARIELAEGEIQKAIDNLDKAIIKDKYNVEAKFRKSQILISEKRFEEAILVLNVINETDPDVWIGYHYKIMVYLEQKKYEKAQQVFEKAISLFPNENALKVDKMLILEKKGEYNQAIEAIYNELTNIDSDTILLEKAKMLLAQEKLEKAAELFEKIITKSNYEPVSEEARYHLMNISIATSKFKKAHEYASEIIEQNSKTSFYYAASYLKPFCLKKLGNIIDSEREFLSLIADLIKESANKPEKLELYLYVAMCYKEIKNYNKALDIIKFLLSVNENISEAYLLRAEINKELNKNELSEKDINIARSKSKFIDTIFKNGGSINDIK